MINPKLARDEMVLAQVERRGIHDARVLEAMRKVKRHEFVEPAFRERAYDDTPLPIEEGQTISQPYMVGRMTSLLEIRPTDRVLEIGTGSGYQTAILAELAAKVYSIERHVRLLQRARVILDQQGYRNIVLRHGDGTIGWAEFAPFDRILVTAAAPGFPRTLFNQLAEGGLMIFPMGEKQMQALMMVEKQGDEPLIHEAGQVSFVPLIGREGWQYNNSDS
jgi:protein-L-isoaspartate(D-aspartate) O-methyltransferase